MQAENSGCSDVKSYTTYITGSISCNGWAGISLDQCKEKCTNNEVPNDSCPRKGAKCAYVHYYPATKWCHLADDTCALVNKGSGNIAYQKGTDSSFSLLLAEAEIIKNLRLANTNAFKLYISY